MVLVAVLAACDISGVPNVEGTYRGEATLRALSLALEIPVQATLTVQQAGDQLTVYGSITVYGVTAEIPAVGGTIDATGYFTVTKSGFTGSMSDNICGTYRPIYASMTFSGGQARYVERTATTRCGNVDLAGTLTRE